MTYFRVVPHNPCDTITIDRVGHYHCGYRTNSSIAILYPDSRHGWGFVYAEDIVKARVCPGYVLSGKFKAPTKKECIQKALNAGRKIIASESVREVMRILINQFPESEATEF